MAPQEKTSWFEKYIRTRENIAAVRTTIFYRLPHRSHGYAVDDLEADTFFSAWRNSHKFRGDSKPRTWLERIACNITFNWVRGESRKLDSAVIHETNIAWTEAEGLVQNCDTGSDPFKQVYRMELSKHLAAALAELSAQERKMLLMYEVSKMSQRDIAQHFSITRDVARYQIDCARLRAAKYLEAAGVRP